MDVKLILWPEPSHDQTYDGAVGANRAAAPPRQSQPYTGLRASVRVSSVPSVNSRMAGSSVDCCHSLLTSAAGLQEGLLPILARVAATSLLDLPSKGVLNTAL